MIPDVPTPRGALLLQALNEAFDVADARLAVTTFHPPPATLGLLFCLGLVAALLAGWGLAGAEGSTRLHRAVFAGAVALVVYVSLDLELPRRGLIRVDASDALLEDVRAGMR